MRAAIMSQFGDVQAIVPSLFIFLTTKSPCLHYVLQQGYSCAPQVTCLVPPPQMMNTWNQCTD
jgi:hypothetical protein